jgi:hypothetical protein
VFNRIVYHYTSSVPIRTEARRYRLMVMLWSDHAIARRLRRANPRLKILMYDNGLVSQTDDPHLDVTCTQYAADAARHPNWFLHNTVGRRVAYAQYPGYYLMDVGNPGYQFACISQAIRRAKQFGFDGVFFDTFTAWWRYAAPTQTVRAYRTPRAWQNAVTSFLVRDVTALHGHRLLAFGNIGGARITHGLWQRWAGRLDGAAEESWTDAGSGPAEQVLDWPTKLSWVHFSESHHKYTILHTYSGTPAGDEYALASMLLVAGGYTSFTTGDNYSVAEVWWPIYGRARRLGAPRGGYVRRRNGVYERHFAHGIVVVNPTHHGVRRFGLGGRFSGTPGTVSSIGLGPTSGLILLS